jgi:hypothetical protein
MLLVPPSFELANLSRADAPRVVTEAQSAYSIPGRKAPRRRALRFGLLPSKDASVPRTANVIKPADHDVWQASGSPPLPRHRHSPPCCTSGSSTSPATSIIATASSSPRPHHRHGLHPSRALHLRHHPLPCGRQLRTAAELKSFLQASWIPTHLGTLPPRLPSPPPPPSSATATTSATCTSSLRQESFPQIPDIDAFISPDEAERFVGPAGRTRRPKGQ